MELTYLAIGACGLVAACALVAVIALHAKLADLEQTVQSNYKWLNDHQYNLLDKIYRLDEGMVVLGLEYKSSTPAAWAKKEETQA